MRKQMRTAASVMLVLLLAMTTLLAACSSNKEETNSNANTNGNTAAGNADKPAGPDPELIKAGTYKYDPPITITTWGCYTQSVKYPEGESFEDNYMTKWFRENRGIDFKYEWTTVHENEACKTKMQLSISSGEKLPDMLFTGDWELINQLKNSGQFMDVSELFNTYAKDQYREIMDQNAITWSMFKKDGKPVMVPITADPHGNAKVLWLRQDWLDKLGLTAPTTLDEMEVVMEAFKTQDPDGNGQDDTIAFGASAKGGTNDSMGGLDFLFGAFGSNGHHVIKDESGKLISGSVHPGSKQALAKLASWYEKGYLDPEVGLHDGTKVTELVLQGKIGMFAGPNWAPYAVIDLEKNVPGAKLKAYPIPAGPDGKIGFDKGHVAGNGVFINKNFAHPEAIMLYMNIGFEYMTFKEPSDYVPGFVEGKDYTIGEDGKMVVNWEVRPEGAVPTGWPIDINAGLDSLVWLSEGNEPRDALDEANMSIPLAWEPTMIINQYKDQGIQNLYLGEQSQVMKEKGAALEKMRQETYTKIIYGKEPIDAFDAFVEKWYESGGDQMTQEWNDLYEKNAQQ